MAHTASRLSLGMETVAPESKVIVPLSTFFLEEEDGAPNGFTQAPSFVFRART